MNKVASMMNTLVIGFKGRGMDEGCVSFLKAGLTMGSGSKVCFISFLVARIVTSTITSIVHVIIIRIINFSLSIHKIMLVENTHYGLKILGTTTTTTTVTLLLLPIILELPNIMTASTTSIISYIIARKFGMLVFYIQYS